jgi:hypothetical protein
MLGWVWFRAKDLSRAMEMFAAMAGFNGFTSLDFLTWTVLYPTTVGALLIGAVLAIAWAPCRELAPRPAWLSDSIATALLFALSIVSVAAGSYSPFLYFRF